MIEMEVHGVCTGNDTPYPQVVLKEKHGDTSLRIAIGQFESLAISLTHNEESPIRPISYDLAVAILKVLDARIVKVEITNLQDNTYFAEVQLQDEHGATSVLDSRPSDAIALALRMGAPIFAANTVVEAAAQANDTEKLLETDAGYPTASLVLKTGTLDLRPTTALQSRTSSPGIAPPTNRIDQLKRMLARAVAEEAYEEAARLRDEIQQLDDPQTL